jgi:hypothetical protein
MREVDSTKAAIFVIFIIGVIGILAWPFMTADTRHTNAQELARQWVSEMFTPAEAATARVSCQAIDSDHNGYVSCTLNIVREGHTELVPIECNSYVVMNVGDTCRPLVPFTLGRR